MKTLFIPAKLKSKINEKKILEVSRKLPKEIAIAYSIQFEKIATEIKNILSKNHKINSFFQTLGCLKPKIPKTTSAILLIGEGKFHSIALAAETSLPVFILNENSFSKITSQEIDKFKSMKKASYLKFLNAEKIGILVSLKPGQQKLKKALETKKQIKNKKTYLFLSDNIPFNEFENFQLDSYINTACPRLDFDSKVINIGDLNLRKRENCF